MKTIQLVSLMFTIILMGGCGIERRSPSNVKHFLLDTERLNTATGAVTGGCLRIRPCRVAAAFSGRSLVYRTGAVLYEQDYYNLFLTNPDNQITDILRGWFRQAGFSECVAGNESSVEQYTIEPRIDTLCADFSDKANAVAVVQMHITVTKLNNETSERSIILEKTYIVKTPLSKSPTTAADIVKGLSKSLKDILQQLEDNLANAR